MDIHKTLSRLGMREKESTIYIALLKISPARAQQIASETGIERRTCYEMLQRMATKNIVRSIQKGSITHFLAVPPNQLLEQIKENEREFEAILPELERMAKLPRDELQIDLLSGREGLRAVFKEIIRSGAEQFNFGGFTKYDEVDYILWSQHLRDMTKLGMKERVIYTANEKIIRIPKGKYHQIPERYGLPASFIIYGDTVVIQVWGKNTYSLIRVSNKDFAKSYKQFFERYWRL